MPDLDDDYQNRFYTEGVWTEAQLQALDSVVNTNTFWDDPEDFDELDELDEEEL